ncbi:MAG: hypothetical protein GF313_17105 [Caldithrix sp.]|nr:hypothetical protein [Caldithrix sp.]
MAQPRKHSVNVYVNQQDNEVYWPMDMPIWVRLATSPEENASSFLLKDVTHSKTIDKEKYMQEGIKLEVTGRQFIRWYNYVTKDTVMLRFYADGNPPVSELSLLDAPNFKSDNKVFFGKELSAEIHSEDRYSGVKTIFYSINGNTFTPYDQAIHLKNEKTYHLRYYAVDHVGYAESPKSREFTVDISAPTTSLEKTNNYKNNILSSATKLKLSSKDAVSGVEGIYYKLNDQQSFQTYNRNGVTIDQLKDGKHQLYYYAVDRVNNKEDNHSYAFYLDKIGPQVEYAIEGDLFTPKNGAEFVSPRSKIALSATDNQVGVKQIEFKMGDNAFSLYNKPFAGKPKVNRFDVFYRAYDLLNNSSNTEKVTLRMDREPPNTAYRFNGPHYQHGEVAWLKSSTQILLEAEDDASGVQEIKYQTDQGTKLTYNEPIQIKEEGRHMFNYWSLDNVNNKEALKTNLFIIDDASPKIKATFSVVPFDSVMRDGKQVYKYRKFTSFFLVAVDNSSGIDGIWYSKNGAEEKAFGQALFFKEAGDYKINVRTKDHLGNEAKRKFRFIISDE